MAIYAELLSELTEDKALTKAYFLMPRGWLYSTDDFKSYWTEKIVIENGCEGDIIKQIVASYHYRREEIMSGMIEMGEGQPLDSLKYYNDSKTQKLFPLKPDYNEDSLKSINGYSDYKNLKN